LNCVPGGGDRLDGRLAGSKRGCADVWFRNHYKCEECGHEWTAEWSSWVDGECPTCGDKYNGSDETKVEDLTVIVDRNAEGDDTHYGAFGVMLSPETATHDPAYVRVRSFGIKADADVFAEKLRKLLEAAVI
jgi:hypothetical protein